MKKFIFAMAMVLLPTSAMAYSGNNAGYLLGLGLYYTQSSKSGDNYSPSLSNSTTMYDLKVGYVAASNVYFGLIYDSYSYSDGSAYSPSRSAYGASIGYHSNGWYIDLDYYLSATQSVDSLTNDKDGSGFGLDFGYNVMMSNSFYLGLGFAYKSLSYKTRESSTVSLSRNNTFTELMPLLNLGFMF